MIQPIGWVNENTGKVWTDREEYLIAHTMSDEDVSRKEAIRRIRRRGWDDLEGKTRRLPVAEPPSGYTDLEEWFKLESTPMKNSPTGRLIQAIVVDSPSTDFAISMQMAQNSLVNSSKRKHYAVMTPKQEEAARLRTGKHFAKRRSMAGNGQIDLSPEAS